MVIFEPQNRVDVMTPKGKGMIWLVIEYGHESDTIYNIIINETGEMWQYTNKDIRVTNNITFGREIKKIN